ncbi:MAG: hypothetical protein U9R38_05680 [Candidatus Margulisiibacteriota bacterium]|nr:hypothetical protein [Candidatus Margulisiibacteriota bacterium]
MTTLKEVELVSTGVYLPGEPVPFEKIEERIGHLDRATPRIQKLVKKLKPSIKKLLGIDQCYFAINPVTKKVTESNTSMSTKAIQHALGKAKMEANEIDCIILANPLSDYQTPPTTTLIQESLGIENCAEIEVHSNCTGITKAMQIAFDSLRLGRYKNVAISYSQLSSAYLLSDIYNQEKVKSENLLLRWFLSDSASAVILKARDSFDTGIKVVGVHNESLGCKHKPAMWSRLGAKNINLPEVFEAGIHHLGQDYSAVNNLAPEFIACGFEKLLNHTKTNINKIDHALSTIPSIMLFDKIRNHVDGRLSISADKWFCNMQNKGYSGGSSVIIGLDEMIDTNVFKKNETLACVTIESSKWMVGGFILEYL